jgi:hypothetical protein
VVIPSITSKLYPVQIGFDTLQRWDRQLSGVVNRKIGLEYIDSPLYLHLEPPKGGLGLRPLTLEVTVSQIESIVYNGCLSNDNNTKIEYQMEGAIGHFTKVISDLLVRTKWVKNDRWIGTPTLRWAEPGISESLLRAATRDGYTPPIATFLRTGTIPIVTHNCECKLFSDGSKKSGPDSAASYGVLGVPAEGNPLYFSGGVLRENGVDRAELVASLHATLEGLTYASAQVYVDSSYTKLAWSGALKPHKATNADLIGLIREVHKQATESHRSLVVCIRCTAM